VKLSLNWLLEYVELPADLTPEKLAYDLTMTTVEVEGCEDLSLKFNEMLVGRVLAVNPHPDADRLKVAIVDLGAGVEKEIVCGGINLAQDMLVAVAKPGAKVRWHGEGDLVELKETKIRGVNSFGMICASTEIGLEALFPLSDPHEIADLSPLQPQAGTPLAEALSLNDVIIDIDNKSLTNRPDLWGHYGIARELAAIYSCKLHPLPTVSLPADNRSLKISNSDPEICARYTGTVIEGLKNNCSPLWLKARLVSVGQRPINLLVDLTNYVMFALGQPTHIFDAAKISGNEIIIRKANQGESFELLDGSKPKLASWMPVIADREKPLALAGVMGGELASVEGEVPRAILEVANFPGTLIRRSSAALGVRTESSIRFEKALDPQRVETTVSLFLHYLQELEPAAEFLSFVDSYPAPLAEPTIEVERDFITERIGLELSTDQIQSLLERFGFKVVVDGTTLRVTVPHWRATGDVSIPADLVEEVARLYGYDNITFIPPIITLDRAIRQPQADLDRSIREFLSNCAGMHEIFTYPWVEEKHWQALGAENSPPVELSDPPSPSTGSLADSLAPNLLAAVERNHRNFENFSLFTVGRIFLPPSGSDSSEGLPTQPKILAGVFVGSDTQTVFLKAKGALEQLFDSVAVERPNFSIKDDGPCWLAKGSTLSLELNQKEIGQLGVVSFKALAKMDIERVKVALFEVSLSELKALTSSHYSYTPIAKFPEVKFDLSLTFSDEINWKQIAELALSAGKTVRAVHFVDEYRGKQIEAGKKSIAFQLTLGDPTKTLTSEEIQSTIDKLLEQYKVKLGGSLRER